MDSTGRPHSRVRALHGSTTLLSARNDSIARAVARRREPFLSDAYRSDNRRTQIAHDDARMLIVFYRAEFAGFENLLALPTQVLIRYVAERRGCSVKLFVKIRNVAVNVVFCAVKLLV